VIADGLQAGGEGEQERARERDVARNAISAVNLSLRKTKSENWPRRRLKIAKIGASIT
jgi:hypothetical protein